MSDLSEGAVNSFSDEERETLIEGLEALQRRLRDRARPRPDRRDQYDHVSARQYHLAGDLIQRLR